MTELPSSPSGLTPAPRSLPAAAVFLLFLAAGAGVALGVRILWPDWFRGAAGTNANAWQTDRSGEGFQPRTRGQLALTETRYDFGEVLDGSHATHRFEFQNVGSEDLTLIELIKPCSCIAFDAIGAYDEHGRMLPSDTNLERNLLTLTPGQRGYLDVRTFPAGATSARDARTSSVQFVTNGMGHERVYLELKATFLYIVGVEVRRAGEANFRASRQREVDLGTLGRTERASFWIDLIDLEHGRFDIDGEILVDGQPWQTGPNYFAFTYEDSERIGIAMKRLILDIGAPKPLGRLQHEIVIPTTIRGGYAIRLNLRAVVGSDLFLQNLSGQREALSRLSFGVLKPNEATTLRRTLQYVGDVADLELGTVTVQPSSEGEAPRLECTLSAASAQQWTLEVSLPEGAQASFLAEIELETQPADAVPQIERRFQIQGIVPAQSATSKTAPVPPSSVARCLPKQARIDLQPVTHGQMLEARFEVSNPAEQELQIWRITALEGPPLRFVRAEDASGAALPSPVVHTTSDGPRPGLITLAAGTSATLIFALDTSPIPHGADQYFSSAQVESSDPVTPRVRLSVRGRVDFPAGLYGTSAEAPELMLPIHEIWIPAVGRTGRLEHEVHLRPMRAWGGSFATRWKPAGVLPWPSFLSVEIKEIVAPDESPYVALRLRADGAKQKSPYAARMRIETEIGGGYAWEVDVRGEVVDDFVFVREEALRDRSGPQGELLLVNVLREVQEIVLRPKADSVLEHIEVLRYLGGNAAFAFDPRPHVHWKAESETNHPVLEVELLSPEPPTLPDARIVLRLPRGAAHHARGEIELRGLDAEVEALRIPFAIQPATSR